MMFNQYFIQFFRNGIFLQTIERLKPHTSSRVTQSEGDMEDIYTLIPFLDKERSFFLAPVQTFLFLRSKPVTHYLRTSQCVKSGLSLTSLAKQQQ